MNVLFWLNMGLDSHSTSGHLLMAVIEQVKKLGSEVTVLSKDTGGKEPAHLERLAELGVHSRTILFSPPEKSNFAKRYLFELQYIRQSSRLLNDSYNAVFIQSNFAAGFSVAIARRKCPHARIIYNVQDVYPQDVMYAGRISSSSPIYRTMLNVQKYAYRHSDEIITISEDMEDLIVEAGAPKEKITVIYNWSYQDGLFDKADIAPVIAEMFEPDVFHVVYAGNIGLFQNVDIVVDAAERLKGNENIRFHIFGSGLYKEQLEKRAAENGLDNLSFHPIQPHQLAPSVYASASINLIPLGKNQYRAALPSKTATCLACQRPIIFIIGKESKFGQRVMRETNCPVLAVDDVDGLVDCILKIRDGGIQTQTRQFFKDNCSITKNSMAYARIITDEERENKPV